jgi:hypothetical protein
VDLVQDNAGGWHKQSGGVHRPGRPVRGGEAGQAIPAVDEEREAALSWHFNLFVTWDRMMLDVIKPVPRLPPEPVPKLSLLLWKFLTIGGERLSGVICVVFLRGIPAGFGNHLRHF